MPLVVTVLVPNQELKYKTGQKYETMNAPQAIDLVIQTLSRPASTPADKAQKAVALCWLIHLVGDLHQPLHCAALFSKNTLPTGDHGGNNVLLPSAKNQRNPESLHSFWDRLHGGSINLNAARATINSIMTEQGMVERAKARAHELSVELWVREGKDIAEKYAYIKKIRDAVKFADSTPANERKVEVYLSPNEKRDYGRAIGPIASERAAIGGYRLAELLKAVKP